MITALLLLAIAVLVSAGVLAIALALLGTMVKQELSDIAGSVELLARTLVPHAPAGLLNEQQATQLVMQQPLGEPVIPAAKPITVPNDVLDYIGLESEEWAQQARYNRAIELFAEHNDWLLVSQELRREDGELVE